jgi:hypothetical protein
MGTTPIPNNQPAFVVVLFDVPFPVSIPNGAYFCFDPIKEVACIEVSIREGTRSFFRNRPIVGPTSFNELIRASVDLERPRQDRSYLAVSRLNEGTQKATLNIHTGRDGGYAECKYYSQVTVTFLADDSAILSRENVVLDRAFEILNPFLDKYRLLNEDYRISQVSRDKNFFFAACQTSPLTSEELSLTPHQLFERLSQPRLYLTDLGHGAANIIRTNSYELLGPRSPLNQDILNFFHEFVREDYTMPLSYHLILEAIGYLQRYRDYRLAIVNAETAFEVYVVNRLHRLIVDSGIASAQASSLIDSDQSYWGVKKKIRKLDEWTERHCTSHSLGFTAFASSSLYDRWNLELYKKRNDAVHGGANSFSYAEAQRGIGIAKECIVFLEARIPSVADRIQLNSSMAGFRETAGEVMF